MVAAMRSGVEGPLLLQPHHPLRQLHLHLQAIQELAVPEMEASADQPAAMSVISSAIVVAATPSQVA